MINKRILFTQGSLGRVVLAYKAYRALTTSFHVSPAELCHILQMEGLEAEIKHIFCLFNIEMDVSPSGRVDFLEVLIAVTLLCASSLDNKFQCDNSPFLVFEILNHVQKIALLLYFLDSSDFLHV